MLEKNDTSIRKDFAYGHQTLYDMMYIDQLNLKVASLKMWYTWALSLVIM